MMNDYPEYFIDVLRFKAAMGWADEHIALLQEIDKLTEMLMRILIVGIDGVDDNGRMLIYLDTYLDEDIQAWYAKQKEGKK